jgi:hypothetical protein
MEGAIMANPVVIAAGTTVQFPVPSEHPLASYQQVLPVNQVTNLQDLAVVRTLTQAAPGSSTAQLTGYVNGILSSAGASGILHVTFPDITVEAGATLTFSGPISTISAGNVTVLGTIIAHGSFNLNCTQLGGTAPIVIPIQPIQPITPILPAKP